MNYRIDIQHASTEELPVSDEALMAYAKRALAPHIATAELTLRLVSVDEITRLNHVYRKKNQATNVLAFPASYPKTIVLKYPLLGDVVLCPGVIKAESDSLQKPLTAHWAHIVVHGVLHLLGYDHIKDEDTLIMQAHEITTLQSLGFDNPYHTEIEDDAIG